MYGTVGVLKNPDLDNYDVTFRPEGVKLDPAEALPDYKLHGDQSLLDFFHMIGLPESAIREATEELGVHSSSSIQGVRIHIGLLRRFGLISLS